MKMRAGSGVGYVRSEKGQRGHLAEPGCPQAAIAAEQASMAAGNRPGSEGGQFIASVGLVKRPVRHAKPAEALETAVEVTFVRNAADDQVRVGQVGWKKETCGFDGRVTGLNNLLGVGQVMPHEEVDVGRFVALVEAHGILLEGAENNLVPSE
jgi:hypothetical protein